MGRPQHRLIHSPVESPQDLARLGSREPKAGNPQHGPPRPFSICGTTVREAHGVAERSRGRPPLDTEAAVYEMVLLKRDDPEISDTRAATIAADRLGFSPRSVQTIRKEYGRRKRAGTLPGSPPLPRAVEAYLDEAYDERRKRREQYTALLPDLERRAKELGVDTDDLEVTIGSLHSEIFALEEFTKQQDPTIVRLRLMNLGLETAETAKEELRKIYARQEELQRQLRAAYELRQCQRILRGTEIHPPAGKKSPKSR